MAEQHYKAVGLAQAVGRWQQATLLAAWEAWREAVAWQQRKASILQGAAEFWLNHRMAWAFSAWRAHTVDRQVAYEQHVLVRTALWTALWLF